MNFPYILQIKSYYVEGGFSHLIHMTAAHVWLMEQQLEGTMHEKPFLNSVVSVCNTALLLISDFFSTPLAKQKEA